ncbi:MAG: zf-HC2 domain-containing protein [Spirochaetaceae bacterium]|nr:zf-HC2 domain-containing protein [Spirochaetaceae bacterium]
MCPDKEILSAFIDNELEDKIKEDVQNHIAVCKKCALELESFKYLHTFCYDELTLDQIKNAEEKVWQKISHAIKPKPKKLNIWHRRIAIPIPVMAAAVLIFVSAVLSLYLVSFNKINNNYESKFNYSESISFEKEEDFRLFETDQVLDVDLSLPESTIFMISGSPRLMREVDYINSNR